LYLLIFFPYSSSLLLSNRSEPSTPKQRKEKENSHAPIQTTNRNLSTIVITRQRNLRSLNQSQKSQYPNPEPPSAIWSHLSSLALPFVANGIRCTMSA
jgi:hypothetical protein